MTDNCHAELIRGFPDVKLSYETFAHKKVLNADIVLAIPQGQKCFVWFTTKKSQCVCYVLELGERGRIANVKEFPASFHKDLSYGSIYYGTFFVFRHRPFVVFEDVFYYKGARVQNRPYIDKLAILEATMSSGVGRVAGARGFLSFNLPLLHTDPAELVKMIHPQQRIMYFQYRFLRKNTIYRLKPYVLLKKDADEHTDPMGAARQGAPRPAYDTSNKQHNQDRPHRQPHPIVHTSKTTRPDRFRTFSVRASLQNDIYFLFEKGNQTDVAYIPDYKTSVMMNSLFRNIKENGNLDALEESDDEEEFEDDREDKYVDLQKEYAMVCSFHHKFKKWVPLRVSHK